MSASCDLRLDWCGYDAAVYAVTHWHYSKSMPTPPVVRIGAWEAGTFIGVVLFSRGASQNLGKPYALQQTEVCELTRVALNTHASPVSRIVSIAIRLLRKKETGLRLIVSFADPYHAHVGAIYQAMNWTYTGDTPPGQLFRDAAGRDWHPRQTSKTGMTPQYGQLRYAPKTDECTRIDVPGKHRYLYPLDDAMRAQIAPLALPYPKRGRSAEGGTATTGRRGQFESDPPATPSESP